MCSAIHSREEIESRDLIASNEIERVEKEARLGPCESTEQYRCLKVELHHHGRDLAQVQQIAQVERQFENWNGRDWNLEQSDISSQLPLICPAGPKPVAEFAEELSALFFLFGGELRRPKVVGSSKRTEIGG